MADQCKFPGCPRYAVKNGYCVGHRIYSDAPIEIKEPKPIPKKSEKRIEEDKEYLRVLAELREKSDRCEINSPVCTGKMQGGHHVQKTSPSNRTLKKNLKRSCNACNGFMEDEPDWATAHGFFISKYVKI